jgi:dihydropteroate synthase
LLPVVEGLVKELRIPISIDTTSSEVADECLRAGAAAINDISGFHRDEALADVCAKHSAGVILMHIKGTPKEMQQAPVYESLIEDVRNYLREGVDLALTHGIPRDYIVVDPGIGFGKTFEHNYELLGKLAEFQGMGAGVLAGTSRKGFTGEFNKLPPGQRQYSTAASVAIAILHGADMVRVHDVGEMKQVADICDRFRELQGNDFRC